MVERELSIAIKRSPKNTQRKKRSHKRAKILAKFDEENRGFDS